MLEEKQIKNIEILLTHEHPDHISGLPWLKENFNTQIICTNACAAAISDEKATRPLLLTFVLEEKDSINNTNLLEKFQNHTKHLPLTQISHLRMSIRIKQQNISLNFIENRDILKAAAALCWINNIYLQAIC